MNALRKMEEISSTVTKPLILVSIAVLILTTMIPILTFISDINETDSVIQNFTKNSGDEGHLTTAIDAQATCYNIIYLCLVAFVFLLLVVWGVAEVVVRNGTIGVKSAIAITTAAGRYKQANQTAAIDQLQQDLRCCGFILRDSRKLYVACADESAPNCSTAYDTAYWPIQLTIVLSIVDAIFAIGLVGVVCLQLRMRRRHSMLGNNNEEAALNPPAPSINPP